MLRNIAKTGRVVSGLSEKPNDDVVTTWYLKAFNRLTRSRVSGQPIPMDAITAYAASVGCLDDLETFIDVIQEVDGLVLKKAQEDGRKRTDNKNIVRTGRTRR